jgi:hypothetical protein
MSAGSNSKPRRALALVCLTVVAGLIGSAGAAAAAAAPTVTIGVGPDPAESITTQLSVSGTDPSTKNVLILKVKPVGGEACNSNPEADKGQTAISDGAGNGAHTASTNWTFQTASSYLLCAWLVDETEAGDPVVASATETVAVRAPHLSVTVTAPARVRPRQIFQVLTSAQAETSRNLLGIIVPNTGRGCPANAEAAYSTSGRIDLEWPSHGNDWSVDGGPFTETSNLELNTLGSYLVCEYFEYPTDASAPEAAASAPISVVNPPPACVVPHLPRNTALARAERLILAAHCKVGAVHYLASKRSRRGTVIALSPAPGSHRANSTAVGVTVSRGRARHHR